MPTDADVNVMEVNARLASENIQLKEALSTLQKKFEVSKSEIISTQRKLVKLLEDKLEALEADARRVFPRMDVIENVRVFITLSPQDTFAYISVNQVAMDTYSALVSRISKNTQLSKEVIEMTHSENNSNPATLNLVTKDWEATLENDIVFQDRHFKFERKPSTSTAYNYETSKNTLFNVTVAGYCRFVKPVEGAKKPPSVTVSLSEPLAKIARAVFDDLGPYIQLSDEFKFSFKNCSILSCYNCRKSSEAFTSKGYSVQKIVQPCICATKIFDGKSVLNRFYSHMLDMFPHTFIAIMHLKIDSRYSYSDKSNSNLKLHRITGTVTSLLAFSEAKLDLMKSVNLGDLTTIESFEELLPSPKEGPNENGKSGRCLFEAFKTKEEATCTNLSFEDEDEEFKTVSSKSFSKTLTEEDDPFDLGDLEDEDDTPVEKRKRVESDFFSIEKSDCGDTKKPRCETDFLSID